MQITDTTVCDKWIQEKGCAFIYHIDSHMIIYDINGKELKNKPVFNNMYNYVKIINQFPFESPYIDIYDFIETV